MIRESLGFLRRNWVHFVIAPFLAFTLVTFLHESAHAIAVLVQGGTLTQFSFLPDGQYLGHVRYTFPQGAVYVYELIALAPYLMWATVAGVTTCVSLLPFRLPHALASIAFVWLWVVPLLDIFYQCVIWMSGSRNDLANALGGMDDLWAAAIGGSALFVFALGWIVQRRLYRENGLSVGSYCLISTVCGAAIVALFLVLEVARFAGVV